MIKTIYNVETRYTVKDETRQPMARAAKQADHLADNLERVERQAARAGGGLGRMLSGLAGLGLGGGLLAMLGHVGKLTSEAENAQIAIASAFSINGVMSFSKGMERAKRLMGEFKKAAKASPGEARDFQTIFQTTAPQLAKLGLSDKQITSFTSRSLAAAFTVGGGDVKTTASQIGQLLQGQGGADNNIYQALKKPLLAAAGIKEKDSSKATEAFNKLAANNPAKVFDALMKSLSSLDEANVAFGKTFTGMWGSLKDSVNDFLSNAIGPLSEKANKTFSDFLGWIEKNDRGITRMRDALAQGLVKALDGVLSVSQALLANWQALALLATGLAAPKILTAGAAGAGQLTGAAGAYATRTLSLAGAGVAGGRALAARAAGGVRAAGGRALSFAGDALFADSFGAALGGPQSQSRGARFARGVRGAPGRLASGARGVIGALGSDPAVALRALEARRQAGGGFLKMGAAALSAPAGLAAGGIKMLVLGLGSLAAILVPLAVIGIGIAGVFEQMKNKSSEARQFLMLSISELRIQLDLLARQLGLGGGAGEAFANIRKALGEGFVGVAGIVVKAVDGMVWAFNQLILVAKSFGYGIGNLMENYNRTGVYALTPGGIKDAFEGGYREANMEYKAAERAAYEADSKRKLDDAKKASDDEYSKLADAAIKKGAEAAAGTIGDTNITVNNTVKVETNADPDRIAFRVGEVTVASVYEARTSAIVPRGFGG